MVLHLSNKRTTTLHFCILVHPPIGYIALAESPNLESKLAYRQDA